jgi:DNA-binding winged helix-turn-helix (wHTH) protein
VSGPVRLDPLNNRLGQGEAALELQPRPLAVLRYLAERPGRVVPKQELLTVVWAGTYVTKAVLKVAVRAIREALGEDARAPQYIETVGREGYRFLAPFSPTTTPVSSSKFQVPSSETQRSALSPQHSVVVGRKTELAQLHQWLAKALRGEKQLARLGKQEQRVGERFYEAELYRLKGELTLARSSVQGLASSVTRSARSKV